MSLVYLDNSASTRVCRQAASAALRAMRHTYGNPSSLHGMGLAAEDTVEQARERAAAAMGCRAKELIFTSGGTESNNIAVLGAARARKGRGRRIVTTAAEHSSVEEAIRLLETEGFEVARVRPGANGNLSADDLRAAITPDTVLVSVMLVNNETGAVFPVRAAAKAVRAAGAPALVHADAVQAFGRIDCSPAALGADLISASGHKIHAPKGIGALYVAPHVHLLPPLVGGGQERGLRPGTEPVPAIAAFGAAAQVAQERRAQTDALFARLRARALERLGDMPGVTINSPENGVPYILNVSVPGIRSETMLHFLAAREIYVSSGSACARGAKSRVLTAMGLPAARVDSALRVSLCRENTEADIDAFADALREGIRSLARVRARS